MAKKLCYWFYYNCGRWFDKVCASMKFRNYKIKFALPDGNLIYKYCILDEVELPKYCQLRGSEDDVPNYFQGETFKWAAIPDLDNFFQRIYQYHSNKCLYIWCIPIKGLYELAILGFTILFSGFLIYFLNWSPVFNIKSGIEEGILYMHALTPFTPVSRLLKLLYICLVLLYWLYICLVSLYWLLRCALFIRGMSGIYEVQEFIHTRLAISKRELQTMAWPTLVDRIVQLQQHERLCIVRPLSAQDIVSRIMRKENYLIGMLNKGLLALDLRSWVPGAGPMRTLHGKNKRLLFTKMVEWSLHFCIFQPMFDSNNMLDRDFTSNRAQMRKRLIGLGVAMAVVSPFYVIFMLFYFLFMNAESLYRNPELMCLRRWSNLAKWNFREFNELEHIFKHRLNLSYKPAMEYVKMFPSHVMDYIAKFATYVAGSFLILIIFIDFINKLFLNGHIESHNLGWYRSVLLFVIWALCRQFIIENHEVLDPMGVMQQISSHTHYMPKHWRGAEHTETVQREFEGLFKYRAALFFEEIMSIFVTPFILIFALPKCVDDVLQFVQDFTVHVEGVGHVCSLSVFDFEQHGNSKYGSPFHTRKDRRSTQGKMEKSFISFKTNYPNWEPDGKGKQLMSTLADFRVRNEENAIMTSQQFSSVAQLRRSGKLPLSNTRSSSFGHTIVNIPPSGSYYTNLRGPAAENSEHMYWLDKFYESSHEAVLLLDREGWVTVTKERILPSKGDDIIEHGGDIKEHGGVTNLPMGVQKCQTSRWWARGGSTASYNSTTTPENSLFQPPTFVPGQVMIAESENEYDLQYDGEEQMEMSRRRGIDHGPRLELIMDAY